MADFGRHALYLGTCGWSDPSIVRCGRFYPGSVKTPADQLRHYATQFPCVEVDSSHYAIPTADTTAGWAKLTPPGFIFHVKAYGLFTNRSAVYASMPFEAKRVVSAPPGNEPVQWQGLPEAAREAVWQRFNASIHPLHAARKLGAVVFQFQIGVLPTPDNIAHLRDCRARLMADYRMAVEFRDRAWISPQHLASTLALLRELGCALVLVDELKSELYRVDTDARDLMPVDLNVAHDGWLYIRLFRRVGTDRLLRREEVAAWAHRLALLRPRVRGPIFFMMATDHEDQPVKNIAAIAAAVPADFVVDWRAENSKRGLGAFFSREPAAKAHEHSDAAADDDDDDETPLARRRKSAEDKADARDGPSAGPAPPVADRPIAAASATPSSPPRKLPASESPASPSAKRAKKAPPEKGTASIASFFSRKPT